MLTRPHLTPLAFAIGGSTASFLLAAIVERKRKRKGFSHSRTSERDKTIYSLIGLNLLVSAIWRVPSAHLFMRRYFLHSPLSPPSTMITSTFSHQSLFHLGANMLALHSFGSYLHDQMGREQFLAFYFSSALFSSLGSHYVKQYRRNLSPSLGASGAVFGLAGSMIHNPFMKVSLIFLPMVSVPLNVAIPSLMAIDAVGIWRNWQTFDHASHLSGAVFGYLYYAYGRKLWAKRQVLLNKIGVK